MWQRLVTYLKESRVEFSRVTWPTRRQTTQYTLVVVGFSLVTAAFLGGIDALFALVVKQVLGR